MPLSLSLLSASLYPFLCSFLSFKSNCNFGLGCRRFSVIVSIHFHINPALVCLLLLQMCLLLLLSCLLLSSCCCCCFCCYCICFALLLSNWFHGSFLFAICSLFLLLLRSAVVVVVAGISMLLGLTFRCFNERSTETGFYR